MTFPELLSEMQALLGEQVCVTIEGPLGLLARFRGRLTRGHDLSRLPRESAEAVSFFTIDDSESGFILDEGIIREARSLYDGHLLRIELVGDAAIAVERGMDG